MKNYKQLEELYEKEYKLKQQVIALNYKMRILQTQINVEEFNLGITDNPYKDEQ